MAQDYRPNSNNRPQGAGGGYRGNQGGGRETQTIIPAAKVPFFKNGTTDVINPDLVDKLAWEQTEKIKGTLSSSQLRKFFGEVKGLYNRWQNGEDFNRLLPVIKMIKSKAYYAMNTKNNKIPQEFASFIIGGIDQVNTTDDFKAFVMYFEAVVGFMYGKGLIK